MNGWQGARAEADYAEGLRDSRPEAQGRDRRLSQDRRRSEEALSDPLSSVFDQVAEHLVPVLSAVVAPRPLVQIALEPLVRDSVVRSPDSRLEQAKEAVIVCV